MVGLAVAEAVAVEANQTRLAAVVAVGDGKEEAVVVAKRPRNDMQNHR